MLDRLDDAIGGTSDDLQSGAREVDGLVVGALHDGACPEGGAHATAGDEVDRVRVHEALGTDGRGPVTDIAPGVVQVGHERAARRDREELMTPADAEEGRAPPERAVDDRELGLVMYVHDRT